MFAYTKGQCYASNLELYTKVSALYRRWWYHRGNDVGMIQAADVSLYPFPTSLVSLPWRQSLKGRKIGRRFWVLGRWLTMRCVKSQRLVLIVRSGSWRWPSQVWGWRESWMGDSCCLRGVENAYAASLHQVYAFFISSVIIILTYNFFRRPYLLFHIACPRSSLTNFKWKRLR